MPFPRILLGVPLLVAGIVLPAAGVELTTPPATAIGMDHEVFTTEHVTIRQGDTVTLVNNSRWVHIVGAGEGGRLDNTTSEVPVEFRRLMETNDSYTTGKWNTPGEYYLTCSVHPEMTVEVVVTDCGCCSNGTC
jgi:plastocyanin